MSLWVRSQDKDKLLKVKNLTLSRMWDIDREGELQLLDSYFIKEEKIILGVYSSKDKALKVLDYLQIHLLDLENARNNNFALNNYVFQMPQDDEVEV